MYTRRELAKLALGPAGRLRAPRIPCSASVETELKGPRRHDRHERPLQLRRAQRADRRNHPEVRAARGQRRRAPDAAGRGLHGTVRQPRHCSFGAGRAQRQTADAGAGGRPQDRRRRYPEVAARGADGQGQRGPEEVRRRRDPDRDREGRQHLHDGRRRGRLRVHAGEDARRAGDFHRDRAHRSQSAADRPLPREAARRSSPTNTS